MLKKGDKCHVRYMGKIEKVMYLNQSSNKKNWHWIKFKGGEVTMVNRFVCMTGIRGQNENQKNQ